jgi:hypothetical protein
MSDGNFPSKVSATRADNAVTNPLFTRLTDGTTAIGVTSGALDVNIDNASIVVTATDLDIRDLVNTQDSIAIGSASAIFDVATLNSALSGTANAFPVAGRYQATPDTFGDGDASQILTDANGRLEVNIASGTVGTEYVEDAAAPAAATAPAVLVERDDALGGITPVEGDWSKLYCDANGALWVAVNNTVTVSATDLDIRDLAHTQDSVALGDGTGTLVDILAGTIDALQVGLTDGTDQLAVNTDGSINVNIVNTTIGGEIHDEEEEVDVASDATSNHDYTVTGSTTLLLKRVLVAGSGSYKAVVSAGPLAGLVEVATAFSTGRQGDTTPIVFDPPVEVPDTSTGTVRVALTNRQGSAVSIYSTIMGQEV